MVNKEYEPNEREEQVLDLILSEESADSPWGRVNPYYIREHTDLDKGQAEYALRNLSMAGWVQRLNDGGLYEFIEDPRD